MSLYFHSLFQTRNRHFLTPFPFARRNAEGLYFGGDRTTPSLNHTWAPRCSPKLASLAGCSTKYLRFRTLTKVLGNSRCFSVRSSSETWCVLQRFDSLPNIHRRGNRKVIHQINVLFQEKGWPPTIFTSPDRIISVILGMRIPEKNWKIWWLCLELGTTVGLLVICLAVGLSAYQVRVHPIT